MDFLNNLDFTNITLATISLITIILIIIKLPSYLEAWSKIKDSKSNNQSVNYFIKHQKRTIRIIAKMSKVLNENTKTIERITEELICLRENNNNFYEKLNEIEKELIRTK